AGLHRRRRACEPSTGRSAASQSELLADELPCRLTRRQLIRIDGVPSSRRRRRVPAPPFRPWHHRLIINLKSWRERRLTFPSPDRGQAPLVGPACPSRG